MKQVKITSAVLLALVLLLAFGAMTVAAQGPVAYLDNQTHTIAAGGSAMYRFDYSLNSDGSRPVVNIVMPGATNSGLGFQVWTPDNVGDMADNKPVGAGTPQGVSCDTGIAPGACQSPDLNWSGAFGEPGTYYVYVFNPTGAQASYQLQISGAGFSMGQQVAAAAPSAPVPAAAPALAAASTDDPAKAVAIAGKQVTIPAGTATWYSFNYSLNDDGSRPTRYITLPGGAQNGLAFQVYTPDELQGGWYNGNPIGQGTVAATNCDTGLPMGGGQCTSPDLNWVGAFGAPGTYYVRVINNTNAPVNYALTIQ